MGQDDFVRRWLARGLALLMTATLGAGGLVLQPTAAGAAAGDVPFGHLAVTTGQGDIRIVDTQGGLVGAVPRMPEGASRGETSTPSFAPRGDELAFQFWGGIYVVSMGNLAQRREVVPPVSPLTAVADMDWSPSGAEIAYVVPHSTTGVLCPGETEPTPGVFVVDVATGSRRCVLTASPLEDFRATTNSLDWSPDGSLLAVGVGVSGGSSAILGVTPDGAHVEVLSDVPAVGHPSWSADGSTLAVTCRGSNGGGAACLYDLASDTLREVAPNRTGPPEVSPDGRYLAATGTLGDCDPPTAGCAAAGLDVVPLTGGAGTRIVGDSQVRSGPLSWRPGLPRFCDIAGSTHAAAIEELAERGIATGAGGCFRPNDTVSRGQMAALITRAYSLPAGTAAFCDTAGTTFERDIAAVASAGIAEGNGGCFLPSAPVTRGQMATFIARASALTTDGPGFCDTAGHTHEANIRRVAAAGIAVGNGGCFLPDQSITRGQAATFIARAMGWLSPSSSTEVTSASAVATEA